jgi:transposase
VARPTKLTPEIRQRIVTAIRAGNYAEPAARSAGISPATYYRWLKRGEKAPPGIYREFLEEVRRAESEAEVHAVAVIRKAMGDDWRAAAHYLERRYPDRWRRRESLEHEGASPVVLTADHLADPKTRKELREITRRIAGARPDRARGAGDPD